MDWIWLTVLAAIFCAIVVIGDKVMLGKYFKGRMDLLFFTLLGEIVLLIGLAFYLGGFPDLPFEGIFLSGLTGIFLVIGILFYLKAVQVDDISRVTAFFVLGPMLSALVGWIFLGEVLVGEKLWAFVVFALGMVVLSVEKISSFSFSRGLPWMMGACVLGVGELFLFKRLALEYGFFPIFFWQILGYAVVVFVWGIFWGRGDLVRSYKKGGVMLILVALILSLIDLVAKGAFQKALVLGEMGLVHTLEQVQIFFVFILSFLLSRFFPKLLHEDFGWEKVVKNFMGFLLIVFGVYLLY